MSRSWWVPAGLVALGLAAAGGLVGQGVAASRAPDRYVTVKGLSEREVEADLALWPLVYSATGNDLSALHAKLDADAETIIAFLEAEGFPRDATMRSIPRITDHEAYGGVGVRNRYVAEAAVTLRTAEVDRVRQAMQRSGSLVHEGVALTENYEHRPQFLFTALDTIKPDMIGEATRDARSAAEQFARDSGSVVGSIRSATQGYFQVENRDDYAPEIKRVRVVTTVQFSLRD